MFGLFGTFRFETDSIHWYGLGFGLHQKGIPASYLYKTKRRKRK